MQGEIVSVAISASQINTILAKAELSVSHNVTSAELKTFFPNFETVFGKSKSVEVTLQSVSPPTVNITKDTTTVQSLAQLNIINPFNP